MHLLHCSDQQEMKVSRWERLDSRFCCHMKQYDTCQLRFFERSVIGKTILEQNPDNIHSTVRLGTAE